MTAEAERPATSLSFEEHRRIAECFRLRRYVVDVHNWIWGNRLMGCDERLADLLYESAKAMAPDVALDIAGLRRVAGVAEALIHDFTPHLTST